MRETDFAPLCALLDDVWGLKGQPLTGGQKAIFFKALAAHSLEAVRAGLDAHVKDPERGRFLPMPADVIAQIMACAANDGRPGADEAWSIALRAADEADTVVWTREMAQAWESCRPVMALGDEVGARMAFREAYSRMVAEARAARQPARWLPSLGFDAERRTLALTAAAERGLLPAAEVAGLLPAPEDRRGPPSPRVRSMLLELRDRIASGPEPESADSRARRETKAAKERAAQMVAEYLGGSHPEAA
jgi:hypothetical protein